jgi:hypothetical protein
MSCRPAIVAGVLLAVSPLLSGCFGSGGAPSHDAGGISFDAGEPEGFDAATPDGGGSDAAGLDATGDAPDASPGNLVLGGGALIDFGLVDCGGQAPSAQTFSMKNTGGAAVHYELALSATSVFQITGASSGDVAPGQTAMVTLAAGSVPASAMAGQVDQATLTVTTDSPQLPKAAVTLKRTAQGATLVLTPTPVAFGDVPVGSTQSETPVLTNQGNVAAQVTLGAPSAAAFGMTWTGSPSAVSVAPGASVPMLGATFSPTASGMASATSSVQVAGAVCGSSISSIPLTGNGTIGVVGVSPGTLDFQKVNCGATAMPQTLKISNTGGAALTFTAALLGGATSPYVVSPTMGSVAAGSSATITVTPAAIPSVASVATNAFGDTLRITSNVPGDVSHDVTLTETAQGAVLTLDTTSVMFGNVNVGQTKGAPFSITNTGTLPANVTLTAGGPGFGVTPSTVTALTVGGSPLSGSAKFTPPGTGGQSGTVAIATGATDVLCSAPIGPIALGGTGVNGAIGVSTSALDFQSVPCGSAAAPQTFTVSNTGTATFSWSAALGKGAASPYVVSPSSGTLAAGSMPTTVTVTPAKIPFPSALTPDLYGDTLVITPTGIAGGQPQSVTLTETAKGAVITATPSPVPAFAGQQEGQASAPATLTLANVGTMSATVTPSISGANATSFFLATPGATTLGGATTSYSPGPTVKPLALGALSAQVGLAVGPGNVLCQPLPGPVGLSGTGTNGSITLGATSLSIPAQPCGAAAGLTTTLKLTNNGTARLTWNAAVLGATGFSVSPTSGSLASGGAFVDLTVTGPTFATTLGNVNTVSDTLRVTTSAYGDTNHDVSLSSTPSGAILTWTSGITSLPFGTVQATPGGTKPKNLEFGVTNAGNVAATVSFALTGTSQFTFAPQNTPVAGPGSLSANATFDPTASGLQSDSVNLKVAAGTPLCGALPAALSISGTGAQGVFAGLGTGMSFGLVCNAAPAAQLVTISNKGAEPYDFTTSIGTGWTVSPASGTVGVASVTLTVTPPAQGYGTVGASNDTGLSVTTDIPGDFVHSMSIDGTVTGASLAFVNGSGTAQPSVSWGSTVQGTGTFTTYLDNTGNQAATVDVLVTPMAGTPAASLQINGVDSGSWSGSAALGMTAITYNLVPVGSPACAQMFDYTVQIAYLDKNGVCQNATQTLSILWGNSC